MEIETGSTEQPALELIRQGLRVELTLMGWKPGFDCELVLGVRSIPESSHVGLMFLWSSIAFLEAAPLSLEGIHPRDYRADDGWGSLDFLKALQWNGNQLNMNLHVVRGRQIATELALLQEGLFIVRAQGRGESPLHWYEVLTS